MATIGTLSGFLTMSAKLGSSIETAEEDRAQRCRATRADLRPPEPARLSSDQKSSDRAPG